MNKKYIIIKAQFTGEIYSLQEKGERFMFLLGTGKATLYEDAKSAEDVIVKKELKNVFILPLYV